MSRDANRAGKRYERRVVNRYREHGGDANRDAAQLEHDGRATGVDVRARIGDLQFGIQCRDQRRPNVWDALADAQAGAVPNEIAIAHVRRVNGPWPTPATDVVVIAERDWFTLLAVLRSGSAPTMAIGGSGATGVAPPRPDSLPAEDEVLPL